MRRIILALGALVALVVVVLVVSVVRWSDRLEAAKVQISWRVLLWARIWAAVYRLPFDLVLSVLANESASVPGKDGRYPLGDTDHARGPSIGPGQVMRFHFERIWSRDYVGAPLRWLVVGSDPLELAQVGQESRALWASIRILREAYDAAGGDWQEAARRYNGSGPRAVAYSERALSVRARLAS